MNPVKSVTQAYSQAPWRKQVKYIVLSLLMVVFAALVAGVYLSVTARAATYGREILLMQTKIDDQELVIADMKTQLADITSATAMQNRASDLGFEPIEKGQAEYILVPGYTPREALNLAPPPSPVTAVAASLPPGYTESLIDWVRQRLLLTVQFPEKQP
jgi:cell division protein FtsL